MIDGCQPELRPSLQLMDSGEGRPGESIVEGRSALYLPIQPGLDDCLSLWEVLALFQMVRIGAGEPPLFRVGPNQLGVLFVEPCFCETIFLVELLQDLCFLCRCEF